MPHPSDTTKSSATTKVLTADDSQEDSDAAVALIRSKINALYDGEPEAAEEAAELAQLPPAQLSPHQRYMQQLSISGKPMGEVQAAWHEYYSGLSDGEKHDVWREFYNQHNPPVSHPATIIGDIGNGLVDASTRPGIIKPDRKKP
jgi:hypothetical protein